MTVIEPIDLATLTPDSFQDQPVAVLGLARSGICLVRYLTDRGARVTVYDGRSASELADAIAALGGRDVRLALGPDIEPGQVLQGQAFVATSPSISSHFPTTEPRLRAALAALEAAGRVPVVSEVDLFLRLCPAVTIGVTGTKGKTTTSSLIAAVLAQGSEPVVLGGNIGSPLVERLPELTPRHRVVVELSELQLPTLSRGTDVSVYTHVTSDHLDRHGNVESYREVKRLLARLTPSTGVLVLNDEDPVIRDWDADSPARVVRYRRGAPAEGGVGVEDGWVVARHVVPFLEAAAAAVGSRASGSGTDGPIVPLGELRLPGWHSVSNVAAAVAVGAIFGLSAAAIRAGVAGFGGVEHRLEPVATAAGVRFVNDSQGTQPDAVIAAVRSFARPLVLICGGRAKGVAMDALAAAVAERVTAAVLIGESGPELGAVFRAAGLTHTEQAGSMEEAVVIADRIARAARPSPSVDVATVLLSPAAASFDMYIDYAARGRAFKDAVAELIRAKEGSAA